MNVAILICFTLSALIWTPTHYNAAVWPPTGDAFGKAALLLISFAVSITLAIAGTVLSITHLVMGGEWPLWVAIPVLVDALVVVVVEPWLARRDKRKLEGKEATHD